MNVPGYDILDAVLLTPQVEIHRARRTSDDHRVIVKSVNVHDESAVHRCRTQYDLASTLHIPGVVHSIDLLQTSTHVHIVMEDAGPTDLRSFMQKQELPVADALEYALSLVAALDGLHGHHIIHRDLNPSNIIVDVSTRHATIVDLGIAVRVPPAAPFLFSERLEGTITYMAPEQTGRVRRPIDARSDLYAIGCVLYSMLTGTPPFVSDDTLELIHSQIARQPVPVMDRREDVPPILADVLDILLQKDPDRRYQTAYGLLHDLERIAHEPGFSGPLRSRDRSDRFTITPTLYGRSRELHALRSACASVQKDGLQFLLLKGSAGTGKTALLRAFEREARQQGCIVVSGKEDQITTMPLEGITQAVSALARAILREPQEVVDAWHEDLREHLGSNAAHLARTIPELTALVGDIELESGATALETQVQLHAALSLMIGSIATPEHPLVVILDDLQWADPATFEVFAIMQSTIADRHVLVVGTTRAEEALPEHHPLHQWTGAQLELMPLKDAALTDLICDAFALDHVRAQPLVDAVRKRTGGNPLFTWQLLTYMVNNSVVTFDRTHRTWEWDSARLLGLPLEFDVQDLISARLDQLDDATQHILAIASCIGTSFSVEQIAATAELELPAITAAMDAAMATGLLTWGDIGKTGTFEFVHDRVQQSAYAQLDQEQRERTHAAIAATYRTATGDVRDEDLATVAEHLERSLSIITSQEDRRRACVILYRSAVRALAGGALHAARHHLEVGRTLEDASLWNTHRSLVLDAHIGLAECYGASGQYAETDTVIHELLRHDLTNIEEARTRTCHMHILTVQGRFDEMLMNGVEALKRVGISFDREPSKLQVAGLLLRTWRATRGVTPQKILSQPFNQDDRMRYASELLFLMTSAGFNFSIDLLSYMVLMRTMLVLEHGHSDVSIDTYALFGLVLNGMRMPVRAAKYAQMSIDLIPMSTDPGAIQRAHAIPSTNVLIWTRPVSECIEHMERGAEVAIRAGKQHGTLWTLGVQSEQRLFSGQPLTSVAAFIGDAAQSLHRVYQRNSGLPWTARYFEAAVQKVIHAFAPSLPHVPDYDELIADEEHLKEHIRSAKDATAMCSWLVADLQIAALLWNTDTALEVYDAFVPYKHGLSGQTLDIDREFYGGLAHAQRLVSSSPPHERRHLKGLQHAISTFKRWAKHNPSVFAHRLMFLQGAQHLALERIDEAVQSFAACIAHARAESDLRMEALALEWSSYAVDRSSLRDAAAHYRRQAAAAWNAWGATVLAERLDASRERTGGGPKDRSTVTSTIAADTLGLSQESIDIETVLKASATIAGTIVFDELVHDMMRIVLENAGADRAVLVLDEDGTFAVVAETTMDGTVIEAAREPVSSSYLLCRPLLLQGLRIGATIVVDDAMMESDLVSDEYIMNAQPRSIMVLPITHQAKTIGALYLENGNTTHVFTPERSRVLQLLSSQIAVSIENARLYGRQEQLVRSFARFVPVEFLESLGKKSILDVEVGDAVRRSTSILFADIRGFTTLSEQMDADRTFDFLNAYLERVVPIITRHNGFVDKYIGDAVMALFPYSGSDAIVAAVEIQRAVDDLNRMAHTQGWPSFQVGIGLHTGEVMLGTLGSDQRMDTTVIGDAVNVASRLESLTKVRGLRIVASEDLCTAAGEVRGVTYRKIGIEEIRGRRDPVTVFEVVS